MGQGEQRIALVGAMVHNVSVQCGLYTAQLRQESSTSSENISNIHPRRTHGSLFVLLKLLLHDRRAELRRFDIAPASDTLVGYS